MSNTGRVFIKIRGGIDRMIFDECDWSNARFLSGGELSEILQNRLEKSASEIRQLLESYHPTTSNL
jgi:hypothetical protein